MTRVALVQVNTEPRTVQPHCQKDSGAPTARKWDMQPGTETAPSLLTSASASTPTYQMPIIDSTPKATTCPLGSANLNPTTHNLRPSDQQTQDVPHNHTPCSPAKMDGKRPNGGGIPQATDTDHPLNSINPRTAPPRATYLKSGPKKHLKHPKPPHIPPVPPKNPHKTVATAHPPELTMADNPRETTPLLDSGSKTSTNH